VEIVLDLQDGLGTARWDGQRVRQAVSQILDNAVKFTEKGRVVVTVKRTGGRSDDVVVQIRDTGIGIAPEMLPQLFEKFTVAHDASASKYGDTGLGLALSLALCKLMGGDIAADSKLGEGSTFTVILPAAPGARRKRRAKAGSDADDATALAA
jgi:signal transduction histidine kinase